MANLFVAIIGILLFTWISIVAGAFVAKYEGNLFPVVDINSFEIIDIATFDKPGDWRLVTIQFDQIRNDCSLVGTEWYFHLGTGDMFNELVIPNYIYCLEKIEDKKYQVQVVLRTEDPYDILNRSDIFLVHECHSGYFWTTRTQINNTIF